MPTTTPESPDSSRLPSLAGGTEGTAAQNTQADLQSRAADLEQHKNVLDTLLDAEKDAIAQRRSKAFADTPFTADVPHAGLALSGGGVRSATFCLGLIQGLARNGVLRRFDYLSTVSGGGYIGASVGRLIGREGIDKAEKLLASGDSQVLGWLRKNGRYLTPSGARDLGMALATLLRSSLSTHFELGLLAVLLGVIVVLPHALQSQFLIFDEAAWGQWQSVWWPIAVALWVFAAPGSIWAYWPLRDPLKDAPERTAERLIGMLVALIVFAVSLAAVANAYEKPPHGWIAGPSLAQLWLFASSGALLWGLFADRRMSSLRNAHATPETISFQVAALRNLLTRALRLVNVVALRLLFLGVIDWLSFALVSRMQESSSWAGAWLATALGVAAVVVAAMRNASEPLQKILTSSGSDKGRRLSQMINAAGVLVGGLLFFAWTALLQWLVLFDAEVNTVFHGVAPFWGVVLILVVIAVWVFVTHNHNEALNASSLHGFYRGRLVRAYVSVGNRTRFPNIDKPPLGVIEANTQSVVDVVEGDDVPLDKYRPNLAGGPIHLVGMTFNQTVDDHGDLYNADRKGMAAIASAEGIEIGPAEAGRWPVEAAATLGQWVTISGAAAAPGAGSNTTRGWALLLFLCGVRLGYWTPSLLPKSAEDDGARAKARFITRIAARLRDTKSGLVLSEAIASFLGRTAKWWYLSDGGHFENTGVYALIKRKVPFILLADCGADPKYAFEDIENLIRKARIDFDAEIELLKSADAEKHFGPFAAELHVLSHDQVVDNHTERGVLLARICYNASNPAKRSFGTLLIVKPNLHDSLDNDILAYASRNPSFPQQSTADQFFDEAQWESYRRLGQDFGNELTATWLKRLPHWNPAGPAWDSSLPLRRQTPLGTPAPAGDAVPFWRRGAAAAAIGTTLSLSVFTSIAGVGWTIYDGLRKERDDREHRTGAAVAAAQEQFDVLRPILCRAQVARDVKECARERSTQAATDSEPSPADIRKLSAVYAAIGNPENRPALVDIAGEIAGFQHACGLRSSECTAFAESPELCGAICETRLEGGQNKDTYWGMSGKTSNLRQNAVLAFLWDHLAGHEEQPQASTSTVSNLPQSGATPASASSAEPAAITPSPPPSAAPAPAPQSPAAPTAPAAQTGPSIVVSEPSPPPGPTAEPAPSPAIKMAASARTASANAAQAMRDSACGTGRDAIAVYIQIYDERTRAVADDIAAKLRSAQILVPRIENVKTTADGRGIPVPIAWKVPTLLVHRPVQDKQCAASVAASLRGIELRYYRGTPTQVRDLPASFNSSRHVLELWLPVAAPETGA